MVGKGALFVLGSDFDDYRAFCLKLSQDSPVYDLTATAISHQHQAVVDVLKEISDRLKLVPTAFFL